MFAIAFNVFQSHRRIVNDCIILKAVTGNPVLHCGYLVPGT